MTAKQVERSQWLRALGYTIIAAPFGTGKHGAVVIGLERKLLRRSPRTPRILWLAVQTDGSYREDGDDY